MLIIICNNAQIFNNLVIRLYDYDYDDYDDDDDDDFYVCPRLLVSVFVPSACLGPPVASAKRLQVLHENTCNVSHIVGNFVFSIHTVHVGSLASKFC